MDPLSITASIIAVAGVASKVLDMCSDYRSTVKNASKNSKISKRIESLQNVLKTLETLETLGDQLESADSTAQNRFSALKEPMASCRDEMSALEQKMALLRPNRQPEPRRKVLIQALCRNSKEKYIEKSLANIERFLNLAFLVDLQ